MPPSNKVICLNAAQALKGNRIHRAPDGQEEWRLNSDVCSIIEKILMQYDADIYRIDDISGSVNLTNSERAEKAKALKPAAVITIAHTLVGDNGWDDGNKESVGVSAYINQNAWSIEQATAEMILYDYSFHSGLKKHMPFPSKRLMCNYESYENDKCIKIIINGPCINNAIEYAYASSELGKEVFAKAVVFGLVTNLKLHRKSIFARSMNNILYYVRKTLGDADSELIPPTSVKSTAITICDQHVGYSVYSSDGKVVHKSSYGKIKAYKKQAPVLTALVSNINGLALRSEPNQSSSKVYNAKYNDKVVILDRSLPSYWKVKLTSSDGTFVGYMHRKFLKVL